MNSPDSETSIDFLEQKARKLRREILKMLTTAGSGHTGGSLSAADIVTALYFSVMKHNPEDPKWAERDRFILSKGHAAPVLYAALALSGYFDRNLLSTLRRLGSPLQGHPCSKKLPGVEISTGSLGQGLSAAVGMALGAKIKEKDFRVYALLGCGECNEGQIWEAAMSASKFELDNLVAIIDYNKFALSGRTQEVMPLEPLYDKWVAFGWHVIEANGHSVTQLINALEEARQVKGKPTFIIAHTVKGRNIPFVEDTWPSHSVQMTTEQVEGTLEELGCSKEEIKTTLAQMKEKK